MSFTFFPSNKKEKKQYKQHNNPQGVKPEPAQHPQNISLVLYSEVLPIN